jgi:tetratricopeptide (TPR) repeat protein
MRPLLVLLLLALTSLLGGCAVNDVPVDPEEELVVVLDAWEAQRDGARGEPSVSEPRELPDPGIVQARLEALSLEHPNHVEALVANGVVAWEAGQPEKASAYLDRALALDPAHGDAAVVRARLATLEGGLPFARRLLERTGHLAPGHAGIQETLAGVLYLQGELDAAKATLLLAARLGAPRWRVSYDLGLVEEARGDGAAAEAHYREAAAANPDHAQARERLDGLVARRAR